jgi:flavin-dependent dehydrogenase
VISNTDVFIIGGGPAGLACAIAARQRGLDVVIADGAEPPIDKACGEGMIPATLLALRELGIAISASQGISLRGIHFVNEADHVQADFPVGPGLGLRRLALHEKLIERARELGARFLWRTPVTGLYREGVIARGHRIGARWVVGADGIRSRVRKWSGLEGRNTARCRYACRRHYRIAPWSDRVEVYWGRGLQAYVTPVSESDVCIVLVSRDPRVSFASIETQFPELHHRLTGGSLLSAERGAMTTTRQLERVYRGNVALIGDASGSVDAISGEGLCLSFYQAVALADALAEGDLRRYQAAHRTLARWPATISRLLLLLDAHPRLRRHLLHTLAIHPELFARLLALHAGTGSAIDIVTTGTLLGWKMVAAMGTA